MANIDNTQIAVRKKVSLRVYRTYTGLIIQTFPSRLEVVHLLPEYFLYDLQLVLSIVLMFVACFSQEREREKQEKQREREGQRELETALSYQVFVLDCYFTKKHTSLELVTIIFGLQATLLKKSCGFYELLHVLTIHLHLVPQLRIVRKLEAGLKNFLWTTFMNFLK